MTLPKEVREAAGLQPGDMIAYAVNEGVIILRNVEPFDAAFHAALSKTLDEWAPLKPKRHSVISELWDVVVVPSPLPRGRTRRDDLRWR